MIDKAMPVIGFDHPNLTVIALIRENEMSANKVYNEALDVAILWRINNPKEFAKSARWLAIIYRDYGQKVFQSVIDIAVQIIWCMP